MHAIVGCLLFADGWFRSLFNGATFLLTNLAGWWASSRIGSPFTVSEAPLAGIAAGSAAWIVDHLLVSVVVGLASQKKNSFFSSLRSGLAVLPHTLAYGWAAAGMTLLYRQSGLGGFSMLIVPVFSAQVFLVLLARRTQSHQGELRQAEEGERRRIARDLHDTVVQTVAGTAMILAAASESSPPETNSRSIMHDAASDLRGAAALRTLIVQIAPPTLKRDGLEAALQSPLAAVRQTGARVDVHIQDDIELRHTDMELIFRVSQEALRNVVAHAHASHVKFTLVEAGSTLELSVADDGRGFTDDEVNSRRLDGHFGTQGLADAAKERGATLMIDSKPDSGTRVVLRLPKR